MTRNLLRAGALACALLTSTALCTQPALAQQAREHRALDGNGVDLTHGDFVMSITEGSIGSGEAELALVRTGAWSGGYNGHQWDNITFRREVSGASVTYQVQVGLRAETFTSTGTLPSGSSLSGGGNSFVYRSADGTAIEFTDAGHGGIGTDSNFCTGASGQGSCNLLPTAIASPDGRSVSLNWQVAAKCSGEITAESYPCTHEARLGSVSNSFGYEIRFAHASENDGGSGGAPPAWFQRTGATFHNNNVSGSPVQGSASYAYPAAGVTQVTDMAGRVWRIAGSATQIDAIRRPGAAADTTIVTRTNGVVSSVIRDGVTTHYTRTVSGSTATMTVTNALNQQSTIVSNLTTGRPTSVTDALGRQTAYQYDSHKRLTRVTAPEGNYVQYSYDTRGNVIETRVVGKPGSGVADIVTTASYDASCTPASGSEPGNLAKCNQPNSVTDARGNVTDFTYDATHGGVLTVTGPAPTPTPGAIRPQTRYTYALLHGEYRLTEVSACASGEAPGCVGTAAESRTLVGYDAQGNVTSVTQRDGTGTLSATQAMTYNALGDVETVDGPLAGAGDTTRLRYNAGRELIGTIGADPDGQGPRKHRATRNIINASTGLLTRVDAGTVDSQSDADWPYMAVHQSMEADYDAHARPVVQRLTGGGAAHALTQVSYDALGRVECTAQRMNVYAFGSLPASACTPGPEMGHGPDRIAKMTYDAAGQLTQMVSAFGTPEQAVEAAATYRNNGQVETLTDGEGNRTTYVYDGHDRLKQTRYPVAQRGANASSTTDYEELGYDAAGNVTSARLRDGNVMGYSYDGLNRLTLVDNPQGGSAANDVDRSFVYDLLGRMTRAQDQNGHFAEMTFDALGRQTSEASLNGGTKTMQYDAAGRRTRLTWPDQFFVSYDYNDAGDMTHIRENGAQSGAGVLATFSYDDLGRRTSLARGNGSETTYGYDAAGRLSHIGHHIPTPTGLFEPFTYYSYNAAGQILSVNRPDSLAYSALTNQNVTDTHNGLNQVTQTGGAATAHDARGNTTADGSGTTFLYNLANELVARNGATQLYYEPLGRLTQQWNGGGTLDWVGSELIADYSGGFGNRRHVHGPGVDEPLVTYENGQRRHLHADERGSVVMLTDDASAVTAINRYDDYGQPQGGSVAGRFGFTGQAWLPEIGVHYYKARMYDQSKGRFMQPDPIGYGDGMNLYTYAGGDAINYVDTSGTCKEWARISQEWNPDTQSYGKPKLLYSWWEGCTDGATRGGGSGPVGPEGGGGGGILPDEQPPIVVTGSRLPKPRQRKFAMVADEPRYPGACTGVPSNPGGFDFSPACRQHDACYATLGALRVVCDVQFAAIMTATCQTRYGGSARCLSIAAVYAVGVRAASRVPYIYEQLKAILGRVF